MRSNKQGIDVLIFVEDPGAANFIVELPTALESAGISCQVLACGHSMRFLHDRGIVFNEPLAEGDPGKIMDAYIPSLLLVGTSQNADSLGHVLGKEAQRRGIPTAGFVDMAVDASLRFQGRTKNALEYAPEYLFVADADTQQAFQDIGFPADHIVVCGHPAYDRVRNRARELEGQDVAAFRSGILGQDPAPRPVWLFAAEHSDGCEYSRMHRNSDYTLHGRGRSDRRVDIVLDEILDVAASLNPRPFLILRLHPKNTREEFLTYWSEVDFISDEGEPFDLLWACDLVIGLNSILLMEAVHMQRPTLSVVTRDEERRWTPSVVQGLTPCVNTKVELFDKLTGPRLYELPTVKNVPVTNAMTTLRDAIVSLII